MGKHSEYIIPFSGLALGTHTFEFTIGKEFFDDYGNELVQSGEIKVVMDLIKTSNMLVLEFTHTGIIDADCDRCLNAIQLPIEGNNRIVVKFGSGDIESEEVLVLPKEAHELDVAPLVYEFINVSLPARKVPAECDEEDRYCDAEISERMSFDKPEPEEEPETDPRWQKLKSLLDNNNNSKSKKK